MEDPLKHARLRGQWAEGPNDKKTMAKERLYSAKVQHTKAQSEDLTGATLFKANNRPDTSSQ